MKTRKESEEEGEGGRKGRWRPKRVFEDDVLHCFITIWTQ